MIFICDDDPTYSMILSKTLKSCLEEAHVFDEIKVFSSCNKMVEELLILDKKGLKPDVIFMDMKMPNVSGVECIKLLNEVYHQPVSIIAMSADIEINVLSELHKYIKAPLSKMTTPEDFILDLKAIIRLYLGKNRPRFLL